MNRHHEIRPATAPNGWFGMSIAENLGVATGIAALVTAIGNGIGTSAAIEAAGGWSGIGTYGAAGTSVGGAATLGVLAAGAAGARVGTAFYHYSLDWAQGILQDAVGHTVETIGAIPDALLAINAWNIGVPAYPAAVQVQP